MNPRHHNPMQKRPKGGWAHAPYNFVPLPEKVVELNADEIPGHDVYSDRTGCIDCVLETRSPLYTRCGINPEFFAKWADKIREMMQDDTARDRYAQFFHLDDAERPVIPGSSLRGMLRLLVEIAGYGKMQWVTGEPLVYRAVGDPSSLGRHYRQQLLGENKTRQPDTHLDYPSPNLRGGYLIRHKGAWAIRSAREIQGETFVHVEYSMANKVIRRAGQQGVYDVYVAPARRQSSKRGRRGSGDLILDLAITSNISPRTTAIAFAGMEPAKMVVSGHMSGQHPKHWHCAIYEPDNSRAPIPIPFEMWRVYQEDSEMTRGFPTRKLERDGDPLFYLSDPSGSLIFFGPTMMFRLPYPRTALSLVPDSLHRKTAVDLAEGIFGYSPDVERKEGRSGRVFFSDAHFESGKDGVWLQKETIIPKVLGSPKPTTFQHYLVQDKDKSHDPDVKQQLAHYATSTQETTVRGHKLYWHRDNVNLNEIQETPEKIAKATKQYTRIKPVKAGVTFRFRIYFENLRVFELGALLWAIALPGEAGKDYCHSLGMGKPLGLGAVKLTPTLHLSERVVRYTQLFTGTDWQRGEREESDRESFIRAFEDFVLKRMDAQERGQAKSLKDLERIKMLLKMVEWPGPDRSLTSYMVIEPTNEYKERPVLPDPLNIEEPPEGKQFSARRPTEKPRAEHARNKRRDRR